LGDKCQRSGTVDRNMKQKVRAKAQRIRRYEKKEPSIVRIKSLKNVQKILQRDGREEPRGQRTSLYGRSRELLEVTMRRKNTA
jgi:hypothetical protein